MKLNENKGLDGMPIYIHRCDNCEEAFKESDLVSCEHCGKRVCIGCDKSLGIMDSAAFEYLDRILCYKCSEKYYV